MTPKKKTTSKKQVIEQAQAEERKWAFFKNKEGLTPERKKKIFIGLVLLVVAMIGYWFWQLPQDSTNNYETETVPPETKNYPKLLLLGIDAASWDVIDPLIAEGRMPNLKRLIDNGVRATPPTLNPTISPAIWTTIITGLPPQKHGVNNFLSTRESDYQQQLITSKDRKVKALWNILSEAKIKVGVFSYWATWPPEEINGYNVTERAMFDAQGGVYPARLTKDVLINATKALGFSVLEKNLSLLVFPEAKDPNDAEFFKQARDQVEMLGKLFEVNSLAIFKQEQPDVLFQIFGAADAAQHIFTKFKYPEEFNKLVIQTDPTNVVDPLLVEEYKSVIDELYISQDKMIGEYMELAGPDTHIIVISDHGFFLDPAVGYRATKMNTFLNRLGVLFYTKEGGIDYAKTKAFECNNNTFDWQRRICINLEGKYAEGSVKQNQFEKTRQDVIARMKKVKTTDNEIIFKDVFSSNKDDADIEYDLKRDVIDKEVFVQGKKFPFKDFLALSIESGNHYSNPLGPPGIFVWSGPGINKGIEIDTLELVDVAPNILHVLDMPIPKDMDGDIVDDLYQSEQSPDYIASYEENPQLLFPSAHEMTEKEDRFLVERDQLYIHSTVGDAGDNDDTFCFELVDKETDIKIQHIQTSANRKIEYQPHDNPEITQSIELFKQKEFDDLERIKVKNVDIRDFNFQENSEGLYQISVPLDINDPRELAIWTDMSFFFDNVDKGTLRLIAKGDSFKKVYPKLEFHLNNSLIKEVTINSPEYKAYDINIPASGTLKVSYVNDDMDDKEDRNVFIQKAKFYDGGAYVPKEQTQFYREGNDMCIFNKRKGTTEIYVKLLRANEAAEFHEEVEERILDLLQQTGEISATDEVSN